jgi:diadenosine tetraphosphatase ApaH/serine/threonine PP2A family protein phosphatase
MLLAILTDLHANKEALAACLEHAKDQGAQRYAFLGDLVGYGADPEDVLGTVIDYAARGAHVLLGNHDLGVLQGNTDNMNPVARQMVEWTRTQITPERQHFLANLPYRIELDDILLVHANAWAPEQWEYVDGVMEAARSMRATRAHVTFCGHMHVPALYHMTGVGKTGQFQPAPAQATPLSRQRQWLVIPGAVGQPRDGNPAAGYATYDTDSCELTTFRIPYDHQAAAQKILDAGLPPALALRLITGN